MTTSTLRPTSLTAADDRGHDLGPDPRARESLLFTLVLPDEDVFQIVYFSREAAPVATALSLTFGAATIAEVHPGVAFVGEDLGAFSAGPLQVTHGAPLTGADVSYQGERVQVQLAFDGAHEAFDYLRNADGCLPAAATNRFEQFGEITGSITVDGRETAFATTGHRDHSWGVRDYAAIHHYHWLSGQAGPDLGFHVMQTWWRGRQYVNGYVMKDGVLSPVSALDLRTRYDEQLLHTGADLRIVDEHGRTTTVSGERFAGGFVPLGGEVVLGEVGYRLQIDGRDGSGSHEQGWRPEYVAHHRATTEEADR